MTWRERRTITFLSTVAGILAIALVLVLSMRYKESRPVEEAPAASAATVEAAAPQEECVALSYCNGTTTVDLVVDENGKWVWLADDNFPLDDTHLKNILETLSTMTPQQTLQEASLEDLGLDNPWGYVTATYSDGATFSLSFGKTTTDSTSIYALRNGEASPVYIYDGTIINQMQVNIYEMCRLPELPELTAHTVQRVTIQSPANEDGSHQRFTVDAAGEGESLSWQSNGQDVTGHDAVAGLLGDLEGLEIEGCVLYRPSAEAEALTGFDSSTVLWCNYITTTNLEGHFQITLGGPTLDGLGRYARLSGDDTIYRISADAADSILSIAQSGF